MQKRCPNCNQAVEISTVLPVDTLCPKCGGRIPYAEAAAGQSVKATPKGSQAMRAEKPAETPKAAASTSVRTTKSNANVPAVPKLEELDADRPIEQRSRPDNDGPAEKPARIMPWLLGGAAVGGVLAVGIVALMLAIANSRRPAISTKYESASAIPSRTNPSSPPSGPSVPAEPPKPSEPGPMPPDPGSPGRMSLPPLPPPAKIDPIDPGTRGRPIDLGGEARRVLLAGGGRYAAVHLWQSRRIALVELARFTVISSVEVDQDVHLAASHQHVFVYSVAKGTIERFRLPDLGREAARQIKVPRAITAFCIGSASNGPLLIATASDARLFDIEKLEPLELQFAGAGASLPGGRWWAAAQGRAFGNLDASGKATLWRFDAGQARKNTIVAARSEFAAPSADGSAVFTGYGWGAVPPGADENVTVAAGMPNVNVLPAQSGPAYMMVLYSPLMRGGPGMPGMPSGPPGTRRPGGFPKGGFDDPPGMPRPGGPGGFPKGGRPPGGLPEMPMPGDPFDPEAAGSSNSLYLGAGPSIVGIASPTGSTYTLAGVDLAPAGSGDLPPTEERVHFLPEARVLVTLAVKRDRLWLYPVDPASGVTQAARTRLRFGNDLPPPAVRGRFWVFSSTALSESGEAAVYELRGAPTGMTIGNTGSIGWDVPANFAQDEISFTVVAREPRTGQEIIRSLNVNIDGDLPGQPANMRPTSGTLRLTGLDEYDPPTPFTALPVMGGTLEVLLAQPAGEIAVGGGGRYLLVRSENRSVLTVFEVSAARTVKVVSLTDHATIIVAGGSHFFLMRPDSKTIERWKFGSFTMQDSRPLPPEIFALLPDRRTVAIMGDESAGPVFLSSPAAGKTLQIDPRTLQSAEIRWPSHNGAPATMAASAGGTTLCGTFSDGAISAVLLKDGAPTRHPALSRRNDSSLRPAKYCVPSSDGEVLLTDTQALASSGVIDPLRGNITCWTAAREPGYYVASLDDAADTRAKKTVTRSRRIQIGQLRYDVTEGYVRTGFGGPVSINDGPLPERGPAFFQRAHYYPTAGLLVMLSSDNRRLLLKRADTNVVVANSQLLLSYAFPICRPPLFVKPGQDVTIPIGARGAPAPVIVRLERGPAGMTEGKDKLIWKVPEQLAGTEAEFTLAARSNFGFGDVTHRYRIMVLPKRAAP